MMNKSKNNIRDNNFDSIIKKINNENIYIEQSRKQTNGFFYNLFYKKNDINMTETHNVGVNTNTSDSKKSSIVITSCSEGSKIVDDYLDTSTIHITKMTDDKNIEESIINDASSTSKENICEMIIDDNTNESNDKIDGDNKNIFIKYNNEPTNNKNETHILKKNKIDDFCSYYDNNISINNSIPCGFRKDIYNTNNSENNHDINDIDENDDIDKMNELYDSQSPSILSENIINTSDLTDSELERLNKRNFGMMAFVAMFFLGGTWINGIFKK
jgi:hypothetical protein